MPPTQPEHVRARNLRFLARPSLWPAWPFLALVRRRPGREVEYGVLYDALHVSGKTGYGAAVLICNLFQVPDTEEALLVLPKEIYDTPEEIYDASWRVD